MSILGKIFTVTLTVGLLAMVPTATATTDVPEPDPREILDAAKQEADALAQEVTRIIDETTRPDDGDGDGEGDDGSAGGDQDTPGLARGLMGSLGSNSGLAVMGALVAAGLGAAGFLLTSRYIEPKEALKKPQRAMLYGCIKGNPGVNLKQLSEDFDMKTSTVLWHIRKLESADLVRSQKANGLRVFYPVAGGIAAKQLGLAVATLSNPNATKILDFIAVNPGIAQKTLVSKLAINAGTVRWHLRKLKDMGLMAELSQGRMCTYYTTELGVKALKQTHGLSGDTKPVKDFVAHVETTKAAPS